MNITTVAVRNSHATNFLTQNVSRYDGPLVIGDKNSLFIAAVVLFLQQAGSTVSPVSVHFDSTLSTNNPFTPDAFKTYGYGFVNGSGLILSQEGDQRGTILLVNQPMPIGNGFYTEFVLDITNCDGTYNGADGFAFVAYAELPPNTLFIPGGSSIGIATSSNLAAVGFILVSDILTVCAVNSSATFGGGSLKDDTTHCLLNTSMKNVLRNLRCNGSHDISITFQSPASWEIVIDHTHTYTFTKDLIESLSWIGSNHTAYVGFSGGVAQGYMDQRIPAWSFYASPVSSSANVVPILECYEKYGEGSYEAFYGYDSKETQSVVVPRGDNNRFFGINDTISPTIQFLPGRSPFYPANAFSVEITALNPATITWHLGNYEVSFSTDDTTKRCSAVLSVLLRFTTGRQLFANETSLILEQLYNLLEVSFGRISIRNITYSPLNTKRQSGQELAELELEISGTNSTTQNEPRASQVVQQLINASSNTTRMNEVINPDPDNPDPDRNFVGVKTTSTGTETVGQVVLQPTATIPTAPSASTNPVATSSASYGHYLSGHAILSAAVYWLV